MNTWSEADLLASFLPIIQGHNRAAEEARAALVGESGREEAGRLLLGPGDDAAVLDLSGQLTVVSTDTQTENQDFRRTWPNGLTSGGYEIGWKAATQNLADIAAMGARPTSLVVSLTLPTDLEANWAADFARGLTDSIRQQGALTCTVAGGDLGRGRELSLTVTVLGASDRPVTRSGASAGDQLLVAGRLGTAAAGLALLDEARLPAASLPEAALACVRDQQKPTSPLAAGLAASGRASALMDISDGLIRDASRLAEASGVSLHLEEALLAPWLPALETAAQLLAPLRPGLSPEEVALDWLLTGGENHALLATCPPGQQLEGFTRIGRVESGSGLYLDGRPLSLKGWDHFA